jgi:tetratricopeptide (TPR) repeat protein
LVLVATGVVEGVLFPSTDGGRPSVGFGYKGVTPLVYALSQPGVIVHYLRLSLWPHPLCLDYAWPPARSAAAIVLPGLVIAVMLVLTLWAMRRKPKLGFAGACFFLILAPTSSFIPIRDLAFEHRMYLALASVVAVCVGAGYAGLERLGERFTLNRSARSTVAAALVVLIIGGLCYGTVQRNQDYQNEEQMWRTVIERRPNNSRALYNWGRALAAKGRFNEAIEAYGRSIRLNPRYASAHYNLGNVLNELERYGDSIAALREAVRLDPEHVKARASLGVALAGLGRLDEAIAAYQSALVLEPGHVVTRAKLADALKLAGREDQAIAAYRAVIALDASHAAAHRNLGVLLLDKGRRDEALELCRRAVELEPEDATGRYNLGNVLMEVGRIEDAIASYRRALERNPDDVSARVNLGNALLRMERVEEAIASLREAVRLAPRHANAYYTLGRAFFKRGDYDAAIDAFGQVLKIDPDDELASRALDVARAARVRSASR